MSRPLDENTPTSVRRVVDALMEGLRAGRYAPGQRLFAGEFAAEIGLSRSPVREAFHMLAGQGVLELLPNRGVAIRRLSPRHLVDMMELLRVTGAFGLEIAAARMDEPGRRRVREAARAVERAGANRQPYEWFQELVVFHKVANEVGGNLYLNVLWDGLHLTHFNRMLAEKLPGRHWAQYIENYRLISEALLSDEPQRGVGLFERHMRWALGLLRELATPGRPEAKAERDRRAARNRADRSTLKSA